MTRPKNPGKAEGSTPEARKGSRRSSSLDGLTGQEREVVRLKLKDPALSDSALAKLAKIPGGVVQRAHALRKILRSPMVVLALKSPPPTVRDAEDEEISILLRDPVSAKRMLLTWYLKVVKNPNTPQSERLRALNSLAAAVPGFNVPVGVHHSGAFSLEQFVAAAGGKPSDHVDGREPADAAESTEPQTKH